MEQWNSFYIEPARVTDLVAMTCLLQELFSIEQDFSPDLSRQQEGLKRLLQNSSTACVMVARNNEDKQAIGLCTAQLVISTAEGAYSAWIEDVIVNSSARSRGIGTALIQAALTWAAQRGATRAQLLVDTENLLATQFYERLGWQTTHLQARRIFLIDCQSVADH